MTLDMDTIRGRVERGQYEHRLDYPKAPHSGLMDARREYRAEGQKLEKQFRMDVALTGLHTVLVDQAWEDGHASGLEEVLNYAEQYLGIQETLFEEWSKS